MKTMMNKLKDNKALKIIGLVINILFFLYLYLVPSTLINGGLFVYGLFIFIIYLVIYGLMRLIKKKKIVFNITKEQLFNITIDSLMIGVFINSLFFLMLQLISPNLAYEYSFANYSAYRNATTWVYLLITIILFPLFNNLLLRKLINKFKTNKGKKVFSIVLSLIILTTSATYISGLYLMIINLWLNFRYIEKGSLKETFYVESLVAFTLSTMTLFLSSHKMIVILSMLIICIISFIKNIGKEK